MKTVHIFAFYLHNLPKITDFSPWSSMNHKNTKSLHFDGDGCRYFASFSFLWILFFIFFEVKTVVRWDTYHFTKSYCPLFSGIKEIKFKNPTDNYLKSSSSFSAIHSNVFYAAPLQEQIHIKQLKIKHLTINKLPRILLCTCFCRWLQYFPAENTKFPGQENDCFQPREFYVPYENQLHSLREWSVFQ